MNTDIITFFQAHVNSQPQTNGCLEWTGFLDKAKIPVIKKLIDGKLKSFSPRRIALTLAGNPPNDGEQVIPQCKNHLCMNPDHLVCGDEARFWAKVQKLGPDDCWVWTASQDKDMYGKFKLSENGKKIDIRAHVYSWQLFSGRPVPKGILVCHACDKPYCVNPAHLFLGTTKDNSQDCVSKGRQARGEKNGGGVKLTDDQVREIRQLHSRGTYTKVQLSKLYSVSAWTIGSIILRKTWSHID